jgi:hypothetical protein
MPPLPESRHVQHPSPPAPQKHQRSDESQASLQKQAKNGEAAGGIFQKIIGKLRGPNQMILPADDKPSVCRDGRI